MATITKLANVRAALNLVVARELARLVWFRRTSDGYETGDLQGPPAALEGLCRYIGAPTRGCDAGSVWLAPKWRARMRTLKAIASNRTTDDDLRGAA